MDAAAVRARLGHPVVDSDGHLIEYLPLVRDFVAEEGGEQVARRFDAVMQAPATVGRIAPTTRRAWGAMRPPWWALAPTSLDRATAMLPRLLRARLDELGVDFVFLYPTHGMAAIHVPDDEIRGAAARAFNRHAVEVCRGARDRVEPVAVVPAFTPTEAIATLEHAVLELGLKAVVLTGLVPRAFGDRPRVPAVAYDGLGFDAPHDYDPLWHACERLGVAPTFHTPGFGFGTRASPASYMSNHVGGFAAGAEAAARSLVLGGVPVRFPTLRFSFLEGGAAWATALCSDLVAHWERRAGARIERYAPANLDRSRIADLVARYGVHAVRERVAALDAALAPLAQPVAAHDLVDEFAASGLADADAIVELFAERLFAGCEGDDPLTRLAFDTRLAHRGRLGVVFASDLGHWDAPDARRVVPELWEQVERRLLTEAQLRALVWEHPVRLWAGGDLGPFRGTALEREVVRCQAVAAPAGNHGEGSNADARSPASIQGNR